MLLHLKDEWLFNGGKKGKFSVIMFLNRLTEFLVSVDEQDL